MQQHRCKTAQVQPIPITSQKSKPDFANFKPISFLGKIDITRFCKLQLQEIHAL